MTTDTIALGMGCLAMLGLAGLAFGIKLAFDRLDLDEPRTEGASAAAGHAAGPDGNGATPAHQNIPAE